MSASCAQITWSEVAVLVVLHDALGALACRRVRCLGVVPEAEEGRLRRVGAFRHCEYRADEGDAEAVVGDCLGVVDRR